ncbi:MAG: hypothetical protein MI864_06285, partial [Pseudomonadales bacterium]|nr:hypothetical protein [Pseudomonadales bacterium]
LKSTPQQKSRDLALLVAQMMTKYSARSSSSVAQTFQGGETDKTLDQLALDVDSVLTSLEKSVTEPEAKKTLSGAQTKWKFIRNSYVNYNDNNVNYVVNLYSIRMIESLRELSEQL